MSERDYLDAKIISELEYGLAVAQNWSKQLVAERDAARAELARTYKELLTKLDAARDDAGRLAAAAREAIEYLTDIVQTPAAYAAARILSPALAAHDALTGTKEGRPEGLHTGPE